MNYGATYRRILGEYDKIHTKNAQLLARRKEEVYEMYPRIREIDDELAGLGVSLVRFALKDTAKDAVRDLTREQAALIKERAKILNDAGYRRTYLDAIYDCKQCKDTGFVENVRCVCLNQKLIDDHFIMSNLQGKLKQECFENFDIRYYSEQKSENESISPRANIERIFQISMDFVKHFDTKYSNLMFYGQPGLGKTFLCSCIAKDLLHVGKIVLYTTAPALFKFYDEYRFKNDSPEDSALYADMIAATELLIIDDLGAEFGTSNSMSEFFNLINTRINEKKHTIISTNLIPGTDFEDLYSQRLTSRFIGNYIMLKFIGTDIRLAKKYAKKNT